MINQPELIQSDFEAWYRQYPRKVGKLNAERAYSSIISKKKATPEELLAGVMRYSAERAAEDPKFTKHPATWLTGGCWNDEAAPASQHHRKSETPSRADSALDGMRGYLAEDQQ
jgi:hypothetical protein